MNEGNVYLNIIFVGLKNNTTGPNMHAFVHFLIKTASCFFILFSIHPVFAQRYWSLEECIQTALKNNITVKQRALNTQTARTDLKQSKMGLLPSVNGQLTNNWNVGFVINPVTNSTEQDATFRNNAFALNANMNVFNGFQQTNSIRLQQTNVKAAEWDEQTTRNNIALQVSNAYLQILMNQEVFESRSLQLEATKVQLERQQKLYDLGGVNKSRLLQLKAQYANEELQKVTAENALQQSYLTLWQTVNIVPDTSNRVQKPPMNQTAVADELQTGDQIFEAFIQNSPEIKAARERKRSAEINRYIALGGRSPRVTFGAGLNAFYTTQNQQGVGSPVLTQFPIGYDVNGNPVFTNRSIYSQSEVIPFSKQFDQTLGRNFGFTVTVPIFNGWQVNSNINRARINQKLAELNEQQIKQETHRNVNQAYLDFKSARKRFESSRDNMDASFESYQVAESQYQLGTLSINEYLSVKNTYLQAQTGFLQAKYELLFRRKVLDFYLGKPLYD